VRYRVKFRYREDTGEVEAFMVETTEPGIQAPDHDTQHDRVTTELAGVVERDAQIEELRPAVQTRQDQGTPPPPGSDQETRPEHRKAEQLND
jgi:hypothetical protein